LDIAAGIRHFKVNETNDTTGDGLRNGGPTAAFSTAHDSGNTPRFLASYKFTDKTMIYATVSKGFRPGFGLDPVGAGCDAALQALGLPLNRTQVEPDTLWSHELGFKTEFYDRRLTVNGAIYEVDWSNIQQNLSLGDCGYSTTVNSGKARTKGFELEVAAVPFEGLQVAGSVSMVDAKLTGNAQQVGAQSGDPLLNVGKWHAATSVTYSRPLRDQFDGYAHADYQYTGAMQSGYDFSSPIREFENRQPGYSTVNLRVGMLHDDWEVAMFVQNLTDVRPRLSSGNFISPDVNVYTMRPRTIGLNLKKKF
jgi:outer membrane receptor protein involved in Fe transport